MLLMFFAPHQIKGAMSQKPVTMEQLKQILQLKNDGIAIREIARRIGISRNSVRKYLAQLETCNENLTNKELAGKAYNNDLLELNVNKQQQLFQHFESAEAELMRTGVTRRCGRCGLGRFGHSLVCSVSVQYATRC